MFVAVKYVLNRFIQDFYLWPMEVRSLSGLNGCSGGRSIWITIDGGCRFLFVGFYPCRHCSVGNVLGLSLYTLINQLYHEARTNDLSHDHCPVKWYNGDMIQRHAIHTNNSICIHHIQICSGHYICVHVCGQNPAVCFLTAWKSSVSVI